MKRNDLTVGMAVYYDRHGDWETRGVGGGEKVTVQALWARNTRNRFRRPLEVPEGTRNAGVLVQDGHGGNFVVPLAHLRGPYEQTAVKVQNATVREEQHQRDAERQRQDALAAARDVVRRLQIKGIPSHGAYAYSADVVHISPDVLASIVDALDAAGWTYPTTR